MSMFLILLAALVSVTTATAQHPPFSKQVTEHLANCSQVIWVPNLDEPTFSSIMMTTEVKSICVTAPQRKFSTYALLWFLPTLCIHYDGTLPLLHTIDGISIYQRSTTYRNRCVGSRTHRQLAKQNATVDVQRFVVIMKSSSAAKKDLSYMVSMVVLFTVIGFGVVRKLIYASGSVFVVKDESPEEEQEKLV